MMVCTSYCCVASAKIKNRSLSVRMHTNTSPTKFASGGLDGVFAEIYADLHDKSEGLREKLLKHDCKIEETIFVGDATHEVEAGKSVGIKTVSVTWGFKLEEDLRKANPDFIAHTPKELEAIIFQK